eukprot:CAMPEP_0117421890 /NCGR_PEP_ID=MMETSP0758-20121206/2847_1 /TAXON_ID=63605 /ORGANISM="Percolomonas cosmopolitus, Strain AE-1 (ATCC 50343)" /LENGTH=170 /DNA_ID=CAMNT_0005204197 /DNA_START=18 /DNA_END=526 /DNA_ORIENTATION=+
MSLYDRVMDEPKGENRIKRSPDEQIEIGTKLKEEGNMFFREGDFDEAIKRYEKAFELLLPDLTCSDEDRIRITEYELMMLGNIAAVKLKQGKFKDCSDCCKKIIYEHEQHEEVLNTKLFVNFPNVIERAYFRRGVIALENDDFDQAIDDFEKMLKENPDNAVAKSHLLRA